MAARAASAARTTTAAERGDEDALDPSRPRDVDTVEDDELAEAGLSELDVDEDDAFEDDDEDDAEDEDDEVEVPDSTERWTTRTMPTRSSPPSPPRRPSTTRTRPVVAAVSGDDDDDDEASRACATASSSAGPATWPSARPSSPTPERMLCRDCA